MAMAIISGCVGLVFLLIAICLRTSYKRKLNDCIMETTGTVVDYEYKGLGSSGDSQRTWHPVFEYYAKGKRIRKVSNVGTTKKPFELGRKVTVFYNPEKVSEYYVLEVTQGKQLGVIFFIISIFIMVCSGVFWCLIS